MVGQKAEQIQRFEYAGDVVAIGHHYAVDFVPDHQRQRIAQLIFGAHLDQGKIGQLAHFELV